MMDAETQNTVSFINLAAVFFFALVLVMVMVRTYMRLISVVTKLLERVVDTMIERKKKEPYPDPVEPVEAEAEPEWMVVPEKKEDG